MILERGAAILQGSHLIGDHQGLCSQTRPRPSSRDHPLCVLLSPSLEAQWSLSSALDPGKTSCISKCYCENILKLREFIISSFTLYICTIGLQNRLSLHEYSHWWKECQLWSTLGLLKSISLYLSHVQEKWQWTGGVTVSNDPESPPLTCAYVTALAPSVWQHTITVNMCPWNTFKSDLYTFLPRDSCKVSVSSF